MQMKMPFLAKHRASSKKKTGYGFASIFLIGAFVYVCFFMDDGTERIGNNDPVKSDENKLRGSAESTVIQEDHAVETSHSDVAPNTSYSAPVSPLVNYVPPGESVEDDEVSESEEEGGDDEVSESEEEGDDDEVSESEEEGGDDEVSASEEEGDDDEVSESEEEGDDDEVSESEEEGDDDEVSESEEEVATE